MCTNYRAPNEPQGFSDLKPPMLGTLYDRAPWCMPECGVEKRSVVI